MIHFGTTATDRFNDLMHRLGLSQAELARRLSESGGQTVTRGTVWRWASGQRTPPPAVLAYLDLLQRARAGGLDV